MRKPQRKYEAALKAESLRTGKDIRELEGCDWHGSQDSGGFYQELTRGATLVTMYRSKGE